MTDAFKTTLVATYDIDDTNFAKTTMTKINNFFAQMKPSTSKIDPQRLGSKSVFISKLRAELLDKSGGYELDQPNTAAKQKFNQMTPAEQLRFQTQCKLSGVGGNAWVIPLEIMPRNIDAIRMSAQEQDALKKQRSKIDTGKLRQEVQEVDTDTLIQNLMPNLVDPTCPISAVISAVLLATGRRTVEILKTAKFYLAKEHKIDGYACMFSGQCKVGLFDVPDYEIPLLAPYNMIKVAMDRIRKECDTKTLETDAVNLRYASNINYFLKKNFKLNAHALRSIYAMATYLLLPKKISLIGHISRVLGHAQPVNAAYYQRLEIVNFTGPYVPPKELEVEEKPIVEEVDETGGWNVSGKVELKKIQSILSFMEYCKPMTPSALRRFSGSTMGAWSRILDKNKDLVEAYNKSLN